MSDRDALLAWLDDEADRQVEFLQAFTRIDTCNPPGDTREAAALFTSLLDEEGAPHRIEAPQEAFPNLVSSVAGSGPGRHLVLNGHFDVFPVGERAAWSHDPLSGDVIDGHVYGRGTVDMKGGTTALLFAHVYLHRLRGSLPGRATLTVVSDEETGGRWGAEWLTTRCADEVLGDVLLNAEPSGVHTIRFGEKSILWLRLGVEVPGGHSAYPHTSPSATKIAARVIQDLEEIEALEPDEPDAVSRMLARSEVAAAIDRSLGRGAVEVVRRISVNVGVVEAGVKINMLPRECILDVDFRLPVGIERPDVVAAVEAIAARHEGVSVEVLFDGGPEANWSDPDHEMAGHLIANAARGLDATPHPIISLGGSDARFWRAAGVPAFVYGCSPEGMGAPNERISVDEFHHVLRTHTLAAFDYLTASEGAERRR